MRSFQPSCRFSVGGLTAEVTMERGLTMGDLNADDRSEGWPKFVASEDFSKQIGVPSRTSRACGAPIES
jgi:hypothetical protein